MNTAALLMGDWQPHPQLQRAVEIWTQYYEQTEAFDQLYCQHRSPHTGNAIPVDQWERRVCTQNAHAMLTTTRRMLNREDIPADVSTQAQRMALDVSERRR